LVSDSNNFDGTDSRGNDCYSKIIKGGKQLWAYVREVSIRDGGINNSIMEFNEVTGYSKMRLPKCRM